MPSASTSQSFLSRRPGALHIGGLVIWIFASELAPLAPAAKFVCAELVGEDIIASNVAAVMNRVNTLPEPSRFQYLADWVLPTAEHASIRLNGTFTQTDPAPLTIHSDNAAVQPVGGVLVSPVFELLDLAATEQRLPELRERVAKLDAPQTDLQRRARAALDVLLALEMHDDKATEATLGELHTLVVQSSATRLHEMWPETLAVTRAFQRSPKSEAVGDLLQTLIALRTDRGVLLTSPEWHYHIFSLSRQQTYQQRFPNVNVAELPTGVSLRQWRSNSRRRAFSRGSSFPQPVWYWNGQQIDHVAGHEEDYLYFQSPLTGDFEVHFDAQPSQQTQMLVGGNVFGPHGTTHIVTGEFRVGGVAELINPPLKWLDHWVHCRIVEKGGVRTSYVNGRQVRIDQLSPQWDPWIGIRAWARNEGKIWDVRITGAPTIPESLPLSTNPELAGWHTYHEDTVGTAEAAWRFVGEAGQPGQIIGRRQPAFAESYYEHLLRYHRPLFEDGSVEYEFFYEPGQVLVCPALDRLTFLLDPEDVRIHWITDERFDASDVAASNATQEPQNRRGPQALPLQVGQWNQMRVAVVGSTVTLTLNGQVIYERELEPTNSRHFGLFHFADQTEARVRNVVLRGDWPKTLPTIDKQELASQSVVSILANAAKLGPVFTHRCSSIIPTKYFEVPPPDGVCQVRPSRAGWRHSHQTAAGWHSSVRPKLELHGDFDVNVRFEGLETTQQTYAGCGVRLTTNRGHLVSVNRRAQANTHQWVVMEWSIPTGSGENRTYHQTLTTESTAGHIRVVRQGDTFYGLYADGDSREYQLVGSAQIEGSGQLPITFTELAAISDAGGKSTVVWKDVRLAASPLSFPNSVIERPPSGLFVMNADGSELRQLTESSEEFVHGSPDWSPDGQRIAFDGWTGSSGSSHIFVMNADGSAILDLGIGLMPTFSADGQRLAFSWSPKGISVVNVDGTDRELLSTDGWGAQWSPDGQSIAFGAYRQVNGVAGTNIAVMDIASKKTRYLLEGEHAQRYSQIIWNMEWAPDSQQICFKGQFQGTGGEMAITSVLGSSKGFQILTTEPIEPDFSWHPDGSQILLTKPSPEHTGNRLFKCELQNKEYHLLPGQPLKQVNSSGVWSPDGKRIVFASQHPPTPIPWKPE